MVIHGSRKDERARLVNTAAISKIDEARSVWTSPKRGEWWYTRVAADCSPPIESSDVTAVKLRQNTELHKVHQPGQQVNLS